MYVWFWGHLPGPFWARLLAALLAFAAVVVVLLFLLFPAVEPLLPFGDVTIHAAGGAR